MKLVVDSDNYIRVSVLALASGAAISSVTSVATQILDSSRVLVTNSNISLAEVGSEVTEYEGTYPETVSLTADATYIVQVTVTIGTNVTILERSVTATREA